MAQLRDSKTSEIIYTGDPSVVAKLGKELGYDNVLFDDVGENFDPDAVIAAHAENLAGVEAASKSRGKDATTESRAAAKEGLEPLKAVDAEVAGVAGDAQAALEAARAKLED